MRALAILATVACCLLVTGCALGGMDCVTGDTRCIQTVRQCCVAGRGWQPLEDCSKRGDRWECRNDVGPVRAACVRWAW